MQQAGPGGASLVFVERGAWRRRTSREGEVVLDAATVALSEAGEASVVGHLPGAQDCFTCVDLDEAQVEDLRRWGGHLRTGPVLASTPVLLAHADLVAARYRQSPERDVAALAGRLVAAVRRSALEEGAARAPRGSPVVEGVRARLHHPPGGALTGLGGAGVSRAHLSRTFRARMGVSFTQYRVRLKVATAVHALAGGAQDLAALAADAGFADHAHLTRSVRAVTGATPTQLRARFAVTS